MKNIKIISFIIVAACLGSVSLYSFISSSEKESEKEVLAVRERRLVRDGKAKLAKRGRHTARVNIRSIVKEKEKPTFDIDKDEEAKLTEAQRRLLDEIRKALDEDDGEAVLRLVQKLQKSKEWPDGVPKAIKMAAIGALGWFGSSCLPEIAGFLGDADQEVIQTAIEKYEEALSDVDLSDRERSKIVIAASQVITDADVMDMMLFELNNMRHSVAVETIKQLFVTIGEPMKNVLAENVEFYTCEEGMDTPEKLDDWLKENPDDEWDEEFYGGAE